MRPPTSGSAQVKVLLDGKLINTITVDSDRLYTIVDLKGNPGDHLLRLEFSTPGTQPYVFTFG